MKTYNNEKAVISLTSWKARINTVGKTIESLLANCPGFHVVLVLSEDEFPQKEEELPAELITLSEKFEILWIKKNWKAFKKVLFTMEKYQNVPVISADDDCLYVRNYAHELYNAWVANQDYINTMHQDPYSGFQHGPATIYPPYCFNAYGVKWLSDTIMSTHHDDVYYGMLARMMGIRIVELCPDVPYIFHDETEALSKGTTMPFHQAVNTITKDLIDRGIIRRS